MKMQTCSDAREFELFYVIINHGMGSKVVKFARQHGVSGGTIFFGKGTIKNRILEFLEMAETRKEIVLMLADKNTAFNVLEQLSKNFNFNKPHHGIAFCVPVSKVVGASSCNCDADKKRSEENTMYNAIFTIVDKGKGEDAVEAAEKAGSKGGTIINARGAGIHETSKLFSMEIEPEKEIALILADVNASDAIVAAISERLEIDKPGNGIIFVQQVSKTYGLY